MASIRDEGVCVRHWDWSETSQTVTLLTREHGIVRGIAKGARREKGAFSGGIELLTRGEIVYVPKQSMATLTAWDLLEPFPSVRSSLGAYHAGMYMADLIGQLMHEGDPHPSAYDALVAALRGLSGAGESDRALLAFQWAMLDACGYLPEVDKDVRTGRSLPKAATYAFSPSLGGLVADDRGDGSVWRVRAETVSLLRAIGGEAGGAPEATARANRLLAAYVRTIVGKEPPSMGVLFSSLPGG